jgi:hypothetical protein
MRREMVLIDNCAWDILESRGVDLVKERGEGLQFPCSCQQCNALTKSKDWDLT